MNYYLRLADNFVAACLFLVIFRLAVNIFGGFSAIYAKIRLGGYRLQQDRPENASAIMHALTHRRTNRKHNSSGRASVGRAEPLGVEKKRRKVSN